MKNKILTFLFLIGGAFVFGYRKNLFSQDNLQTEQQQNLTVAPMAEITNAPEPTIPAIQTTLDATQATDIPQAKTNKPLRTPPISPSANINQYLSPSYTSLVNRADSAQTSDKNTNDQKYRSNPYFETLAKQMEEMQAQQEEENKSPQTSTAELSPNIDENEDPEVSDDADSIDENDSLDTDTTDEDSDEDSE